MFFKLSYTSGEGTDTLIGLIGSDRRIYWYAVNVGTILRCSPYPFSQTYASNQVKDVVKYHGNFNKQLQNKRIIEHLKMMALLKNSKMEPADILYKILQNPSVNVCYVKQEKVTYPRRVPSPDPKLAPHLTVLPGNKQLNFHLWLASYSVLTLYKVFNWFMDVTEARFVDYTRGLVDSPTLPVPPEKPAEPIYIDPFYSPTSPAYRPPSLEPEKPVTPIYIDPVYSPTSPAYYRPPSPEFEKPATTHYSPASPTYYSDMDMDDSEESDYIDPVYSPTSPAYRPPSAEPLNVQKTMDPPHSPGYTSHSPYYPPPPLSEDDEPPSKKRKLSKNDFGIWFD